MHLTQETKKRLNGTFILPNFSEFSKISQLKKPNLTSPFKSPGKKKYAESFIKNTWKMKKLWQIISQAFLSMSPLIFFYIFRNVITNQKKLKFFFFEKTQNNDFIISPKQKNAILETALKSFITVVPRSYATPS